MKPGMKWVGLLVALGMHALACGAGNQKEASPPAGASADGGAVTTQADAAPVDAAPEKPFAKTTQDATTMIDDAVNARAKPLSACVEQARARRKDVHAKVSLELGIDQEGNLLGV